MVLLVFSLFLLNLISKLVSPFNLLGKTSLKILNSAIVLLEAQFDIMDCHIVLVDAIS